MPVLASKCTFKCSSSALHMVGMTEPAAEHQAGGSVQQPCTGMQMHSHTCSERTSWLLRKLRY